VKMSLVTLLAQLPLPLSEALHYLSLVLTISSFTRDEMDYSALPALHATGGNAWRAECRASRQRGA